ncbi:hypothetical protein Mycsm_06865 (plasmid) [Mycobacterium sp. JS623]|uniref:hypothetical protein n=1 Tax=Mycobacterium sp. JS623 TaxID=212767 RepID=UPI0002A56829|nr:hypothetical protein [Mycobacterium sp. JS623]AGB26969.1 hypothetical protein Mycsm_06865 [Mycobacterium sp. JS623]
MTVRVAYWLARHPRVRCNVRVFVALQALSVLAVCTAPAAGASTNAVVLNWTGLHDSYGVPVGDYYLSLASVRDQLIAAGPQGSAWDPATWGAWMVHGWDVLLTSVAAASMLTAEVGFFVGVITLALWVMRVTISTYWLTVIGEVARAISTAVINVTTRWGLIAVAVPVGVFLGVLAVRRGEAGRGATLILTALTMPALAVTVFSDPAGMMYGPDGLLAFGRRIGFSTAEAATHNGPVSGGGFTGQVDALTASLITHAVREPLQVFNFGHVVDRVGGCGAQWSAGVRAGAFDGPITAMARCGDGAAVRYAQHLDGTNVWTGLVLVAAALLFGWFMVSAGASVFMASLRALYTTVKLVPSLLAGAISGAPQRHAQAVVWQFFKHGLEVTVFIVFVSVIGLAIERLIAAPLPAELGGANPFAHVVMMAAASVAALYLLHHIRADLAGRPAGPGLLVRGAEVVGGLAMSAAVGGVSSAALGGARGLRSKLGSGDKAPWEVLDEMASGAPTKVLGEPLEGFDPVPTAADTAAAHDVGVSGGAGDRVAGRSSGDGAEVVGVDPIAVGEAGSGGRRGSTLEALGAGLEGAAGFGAVAEVVTVEPIGDTASTGVGEDIPLPQEPPEDHLLPPPDEADASPTTVDPITG